MWIKHSPKGEGIIGELMVYLRCQPMQGPCEEAKMSIKTIGLLSPGDMGSVVGKVLQSHGLRVLTCLKGRSERTRMLAREAQIEAVPTYEELVGGTEMILSIVVPEEALNTARLVAATLRAAGQTTTFVDCNAVSPGTAKAIAEAITAAGSRFIDAGIIGPPPRQPGVTRIYASGPEVELFAELSNHGLDIRPLGRDIGLASGIKMCYAALTKGMTAIAVESLVTAHIMGLYEPLVAEFQQSQGDRYRTMERQIPVMPTKAGRWIGEMEEIAKTFGDQGLTPKMHQGAADVYRFVGSTSLAEETPETHDRNRTLVQVIEGLAAHLRESATPRLLS
jgi:3-hydroxyisobutyrate dehydrogenase-like beta-hydroxyacid dehydrogenase